VTAEVKRKETVSAGLGSCLNFTYLQSKRIQVGVKCLVDAPRCVGGHRSMMMKNQPFLRRTFVFAYLWSSI
jgi:hypothetical protein